MLALSIGAIKQTEHARKAVIDYSGTFGQPESNLCAALAENSVMMRTMEKSNEDWKGRMASFSNRKTGSALEYRQNIQVAHQDFCSIGEAKQGICKLKPDGMQAWDSDYSGFSNQNNLSVQAETGAVAYVNTLSSQLPLPDAGADCKSVSCIQAKSQMLSATARSSMVTANMLSQVGIRRNPIH